MKILITAGSTQIPIDKVRMISNIFKGKTGTRIAAHFFAQGHDVTLLANPGAENFFNSWVEKENSISDQGSYSVREYKTYDDLATMMETTITTEPYDVIIHSSAVSDYRAVDVMTSTWESRSGQVLESVLKGKVKSNYEELYIKLVQTEKLIDKIRKDWGYKGKLVKFKLEVDVTKEELEAIGKKSRAASQADFIVANSLEEWGLSKMYIIDSSDSVTECSRDTLASSLLERLK